MHHPPLAPGWIDQPHQRLDLGNMSLESGETLQGAFVTYVVHGNTSRMHNAAILVTTAIGSTHHRLDFLIGAGKALDTDKYAIIVVDAIGNGLSISPSNSWAQSGARFPRFTIRDMVTSQYMLLDYLGIGRLKAVVGASMGGMQAQRPNFQRPNMGGAPNMSRPSLPSAGIRPAPAMQQRPGMGSPRPGLGTMRPGGTPGHPTFRPSRGQRASRPACRIRSPPAGG